MLNHDPLTPRIIGAAIKVHAALGPGLLEKAYERCLAHGLNAEGFHVRTQIPVPIEFEGLVIPDAYKIDLLVLNQFFPNSFLRDLRVYYVPYV